MNDHASSGPSAEAGARRGPVHGALSAALSVVERRYLLVAACCLLVFVLARTDDWLYRNEVFAWLASGIEFDAGHPSLLALRDAAVETCVNERDEPASVCRDYQNTFLMNTYFFRPIHGFFGARLLDAGGQGPTLQDLHWAAIGAHLVGGMLAIALWVLFVWCLPPATGRLVAILTVLLLLFGHYRDEPGLALPDPFAGGVAPWEVAVVLAIGAAIMLGASPVRRRVLESGLSLVSWADRHRGRLALVFLLILVVNFALPPAGAAAAQLLAFAGFLAVAWWVASKKGLSPWIAGAIILLLFIAISGDHHFLLRKLEVSRKQLYLVFGAYLVYVSVKPKGPLVYALPAFAVFHIPTTVILGLMLFLAELPLCIRRLRLSPLLVVSAVTFGGWNVFLQASQAGLVDQSELPVMDVVGLLLASPRLWPFLAMFVLMACLCLWPLVLREARWDPIARYGLLAMQGLAASFLAFAVLDAEPGLRLAPGYFQLANLRSYLGPPAAFGAVLGLSLVLFTMVRGGEKRETETGTRGSGFGWRIMAPVLVVVLVAGVAKIDFIPRFLVVDAVRNAVVHVALGRQHEAWCENLAQAAGPDDLYILSARKPTGGVENAFSALKLKARIALGLHEPENMRILVVEPGENPC